MASLWACVASFRSSCKVTFRGKCKVYLTVRLYPGGHEIFLAWGASVLFPRVMAKGIGIDAVEIDRIRSARERLGEAFERRVLSDGERSLLAASSTPDMFMAGRFAAKEAVMKVLGTGWAKGVRFRDIEVMKDSDGVPVVHLEGVAGERARTLGVTQVLVSITHTRNLAMAMATGEGPR